MFFLCKTISIGSNKLQPLNPQNNCTSLVVRGSNLGSNIGLRFNNRDLKTLYLTSFISQVLVGILIADGNKLGYLLLMVILDYHLKTVTLKYSSNYIIYNTV
jgi:hypothetical protein